MPAKPESVTDILVSAGRQIPHRERRWKMRERPKVVQEIHDSLNSLAEMEKEIGRKQGYVRDAITYYSAQIENEISRGGDLLEKMVNLDHTIDSDDVLVEELNIKYEEVTRIIHNCKVLISEYEKLLDRHYDRLESLISL